MKNSNLLKSVLLILMVALLFSCTGDDTSTPIEDVTLATITITVPTDISGDYAISGGDITKDGGSNVIKRGVCYSTTPTPTIEDLRTDNGNGTGSFQSPIGNLDFNTTYYLRAYAQNSQGVSYSEELSFNTTNICTQNIFEGNAVLRTQTEVDDFGAIGYCIITGTLKIFTENPGTNDPIIDLTPLSAIIYAKHLELELLNELTSLNGLENLAETESLNINKCIELLSLEGLTGITEPLTSIILERNNKLENIDGLNSITTIVEDSSGFCNLILTENYNLHNINGLNNITNHPTSILISIEGSPLLTNLDALSNITGNINFLRINDIENLESLEGLSNITSIDANFSMNSNFNLSDFNGVQNITSIGGGLFISNLYEILNLDEFSNLETVGRLHILNNTLLEDFCGLNNVIQVNGFNGQYEVSNNSYNPTLQDLIEGNCVE